MITMEIIIVILAVLAAAGIGVAIWLALKSRSDAAAAQTAGESAKGIITQAEEDSRKVLLAAQEEALKLRNETESDLKDQRQEFHRMESRHLQREEQLERKIEAQDEKERDLISKESDVERVRVEAEELKAEQSKALEQVAGLSVEEAREQVVRRGEEEAVHDLSKRYYELEKEYKEKSTQNARKIITVAINRLATDVVSEITTSTVSLPNDEMKGRLIGREGRNIRTLEGLTGVDVIIDDTPEAVTVSCFDPVRREVARLALEKLVSDGRIQPARLCQQATAWGGRPACSRADSGAGMVQSAPGHSCQSAGKPGVPSVRCSSTPVGPQSCPACRRWLACCKVVRTPLRDRRESTASSGDTWGANTPAGRPDAPAAGSAAWSSTCTCQPRRARLAAAAAPASPPPITTQCWCCALVWGAASGSVAVRARGSQRGL